MRRHLLKIAHFFTLTSRWRYWVNSVYFSTTRIADKHPVIQIYIYREVAFIELVHVQRINAVQHMIEEFQDLLGKKKSFHRSLVPTKNYLKLSLLY